MGATRFGSPKQRQKRAPVLGRESYRYQKFISDVAGQDIKSHEGDPEPATRQVRNWLSNFPTMAETFIPSPKRIVDRYKLFREELLELCRRSRLDPDVLGRCGCPDGRHASQDRPSLLPQRRP